MRAVSVLLVAASLASLTGCDEGGAVASPATEARRPTAAAALAPAAGTARGAVAAVEGEEFAVSHENLDFLVSGRLVGDDPAGMGLYLERPANVGMLPMAVTFRQAGLNRWGVGMDQDSGDPYPDFVSVFQSSVGDVFRFREGGRAILGNGIGRPEAEHVLTLQDRVNPDIDNILNLSRGDDAHSERYVRAFNQGSIEFAVGLGGRVGVGKDYDDVVMLDVAGDARASAFLQVEDPVLVRNVEEVLDVLDEVAQLVPVRYTPNLGDQEPRYGLLESFNHDRLFPETVERQGPDERRSVDYAQMTTLLVAAVKELTARVEALEGGERVGSVPLLNCEPERRRPPPSSTGRR